MRINKIRCPVCKSYGENFDTFSYNRNRGIICLWCDDSKEVSFIDFIKWHWYHRLIKLDKIIGR